MSFRFLSSPIVYPSCCWMKKQYSSCREVIFPTYGIICITQYDNCKWRKLIRLQRPSNSPFTGTLR
uniref:Uncharacterized protein n=1 Tax=Arundo donax TaxID=35708 RepID=A0A0A9U121_ARUDO